MSKYQEALDTLITYAHPTFGLSWALTHEENIIQELVDKETPKKPLWESKGYRRCSTCELRLISTNGQPINYCSDCGHRVDWEEENN